MEVGLLGPLVVAGPAGEVQLKGAKERLLLALLLLRRGEVVATEALVDALWGDEPPATAVRTLQAHVAHVRRALEGAGLPEVLATRAPGYVLSVPAGAMDVDAFERHAAAGRAALAAPDGRLAAAELGEALGRWRGDALADCHGGGWASTEAIRLDELRLVTLEDRVEADLLLGRHDVLVGELEALVSGHPLRERLWGSLILALYRSGRQGEALRAYQRARDVLVGELGLEPGPDLRRLEAAVLAGDPSLDLVGGSDVELAVPLPARVRAAAPAAFVGRCHERDQLTDALRATRVGERQVALIAGEPGIGKTTLAAAHARDAFDDGAVVLYGRCDEDLGIPYQPWVEALTHLVARLPDALVAGHVEDRGFELARLVPELTRGPIGARASAGDGSSERYLLFGAVVDLLSRVSRSAAVVLVLDDLQWADRPTIQLLHHLVVADESMGLQVVGTFRDSDVDVDHPLTDLLATLHREPGVVRFALAGLADDELLALVEATAGHSMAEDGIALRDALMTETDGNPFFVGELLRHLAETGGLVDEGLPVSVREVVLQRVSRLGSSAREALSVAAVIGRDFDAELLASVAGVVDAVVLELCDRAVTAAVLAEADGHGRFSFAHALIEHALYDELSATRRGQVHRQVGEVLEALVGDDPGERIGELAYHWSHAAPADVARAIGYAQQAGDRALATLAPDEAVRWYGAALDLLAHSDAEDGARRAALLLGLGSAQRLTGDAAHRETLLEAGRLADALDEVDVLVGAALTNTRGWNSLIGAVDHERVELITRALARLDGRDSPDRARLYALLCAERVWETDLDERLALADQAVDIARRIEDAAAVVDAIRLCHTAISMPQTLALRQERNAEACELAEHLGDPVVRLQALYCQTLSALDAGDRATTKRIAEFFAPEAERIGEPVNRWQAAYTGTWQRMLEGDLDVAEQAANDAMALGIAAGFAEDAVDFVGSALVTLAWMRGRMPELIPLLEQVADENPALRIYDAALAIAKSYDGRRDEVREILDAEVAERFPMFTDPTWLVGQLLWAAAAFLTEHQAAAAVLYERLSPWHAQFANTHLTVHGAVAHYLGMLAHTLGRLDDAEGWFVEALDMHEAMEAPFFVAFTQAALAEVLVGRDPDRARALASAAATVATERGYGYIEAEATSVLARVG